MIKILVVANMQQRVASQIKLCNDLLRISPTIQITFLSEVEGSNFDGFKQIFSGAFFLNKKSKGIIRVFKIGYNRLFKRIFLSLALFFEAIKKYRTLKKAYHYLLPHFKEVEYDVILLNGDRHWGTEQVVLKIAKERSIKTICPYMVYSDDISCISTSFLFRLRWYSPIILRYLMIKYSDKMLVHDNETYSFYIPSEFLAVKWFGTLSDYPWYIGAGLLDIVCVDHKNTYKRYQSNQVPEKKLKIIGDISFDQLYTSTQSNLKHDFFNKYSFNSDKKIIICSLPQLFEEGQLDLKSHWDEIYFLVNTLCKSGHNIALSLHPKMDKDQYQHLESKFNCKLLDEPLSEVLPYSDTFVAIFSSTIIWAVLCGIPSIIVDFYGYDSNIYDFLETVSIVKDKDNLFDEIMKKDSDKLNFENDWVELSKRVIFDGKTTERFQKLL